MVSKKIFKNYKYQKNYNLEDRTLFGIMDFKLCLPKFISISGLTPNSSNLAWSDLEKDCG